MPSVAPTRVVLYRTQISKGCDDMATVIAIDPLEYRHLLRRVARQFTRNEHDQEDLEQSGWPGLVRACEEFDPDKGVSFEACAVRSIRSAIIDWLRKYGGTIHVPVGQRAAMRTKSEDELTPSQLECRRAAERVIRGRMVGDCDLDDCTLADLIPDRSEAENGPPDSRLGVVIEAIKALPERQRYAITLKYGIDSPGLLAEEVADELGCSITSANRYVSQGLKALKDQLNDTSIFHKDPLPMSRLNGFHAPATIATVAETTGATTENPRCPKCGHVYKNPHNKNPVCYYKECSAYRVGVLHPRSGKVKPVAAAAKPKATRAKSVNITRRTPAPIPVPPSVPTPDPMAALTAMNELSVMTAIANLPRAAAVRVAVWAAVHFGA